MPMYSYHIFYFPFKWKNKDEKCRSFSEQTDLENIKFETFSNWLYNPIPLNEKEMDELYNEKNYFYQFVHPVLYDTGKSDSLLKHFERKEPQIDKNNVVYKIVKKGGKTYELKVDAINLNLYSTGVGMLSFYLLNDKEYQKSKEDILNINQYGRRIFPPFIDDINNRYEIAESITIDGLIGNPDKYKENFNDFTNQMYWHPARFIRSLIEDLTSSITIEPVIDDRMFVNCWYGSNELSREIQEGKLNLNKNCGDKFSSTDDFWYKYIFVDVSFPSCESVELRKEIIYAQTYSRWQGKGTLYGVSRYSTVLLTNEDDFNKYIVGAVHMRTVYARMIELTIIQRASILKFSNEVTRVSALSKNKQCKIPLIDQIGSLYSEYIRFVNQIYFREVTTQDQGIELYDLLSKTLKTEEYVEDLDKEIEELHQYAALLDDKNRSKNTEKLSKIATVFLPATLIAGIFGMNGMAIIGDCCFLWQVLVIVLTFIIVLIIPLFNRKK